MIKVTVINNTTRKVVMVAETSTPKQALKESGVNFDSAVIHLDSCPISTVDMNTSFADLKITDDCLLVAVTKTTNN
jgi:hypothetical protein